MGIGAVLEPLIVVTLLFGGAWINRATEYNVAGRSTRWHVGNFDTGDAEKTRSVDGVAEIKPLSSRNRSLSPSLLPSQETRWRKRELRFLGYRRTVETPNTAVFRNRFLSRVLRKFPFLVEAWYWALIYWVSLFLSLHVHLETRLTGTPGLSARSSIYCGDNR